MDVKSVFLNRYVNEEVYVNQPLSFEDTSHPNHVFKLKKALYSLEQAPRAWYDRLSIFLLNKGYLRGKVDQTLFIRKQGKHILVIKYMLMTSFLVLPKKFCALNFLTL